ncbi:MAG: threonine--tRNA ligase [Gammaproteobacteria bacterium]|nr:threonine--tRNA ligase [Gammaproteobacteria bacterium]
MPVITLPDGSQRPFDHAVTVAEVAASIGAGLAKAALAGAIDGQLVDTSYLIERDVALSIITPKSPEALDVIRHSTAHLLAQAVKQLFPTAQVTIGPVIEDGFFYDFAFERTFTLDDLALIEAKMTELAQTDFKVARTVMARDAAVTFFRGLGEEYKAKIIADIPSDQAISLYQQGDFIDLCRGPHVPSTGHLKAFKLMKVAGAYWRGDSNNEMLQRIYGTAWTDPKELKAYLHRLEEAEKRDHRKIGRALDLFHTQEEAPGMVFWHDNGWRIYTEIQNYIRGRLREADYEEVHTPEIVDISLWQKSGHAEKFIDDMFLTGSEDRQFAIKPMNCPCHVQIYNHGLKSYRDLPLRMAEFGSCHRNEASGTLHGLMRVRGFVQDDAHIFCTEQQVSAEAASFIKLLYSVYADFGFTDIQVKLSTRPAKRIGDDIFWDTAEKALADALDSEGIAWQPNPGEGAFYGPKIEFALKDCIGRVWQCGTLQLDPFIPARLNATYIAEDGSRQTPIMLHRAILGSLERFIGILIEHYAGKFPAWLAPQQAVLLNITDAQGSFVREAEKILKKQGLRVTSDLRNEKIGFKIREQTLQRVPYLLVVGDREVESGSVSVRTREGEDLGIMTLAAFAAHLQQEVVSRSRPSLE